MRARGHVTVAWLLFYVAVQAGKMAEDAIASDDCGSSSELDEGVSASVGCDAVERE